MSKLTLKVVGDHKMNCGGCEGNVQRTLSMLPGVAEVKADRNTQLVEVSFSGDPLALPVMAQQLETIGYQVELA